MFRDLLLAKSVNDIPNSMT